LLRPSAVLVSPDLSFICSSKSVLSPSAVFYFSLTCFNKAEARPSAVFLVSFKFFTKAMARPSAVPILLARPYSITSPSSNQLHHCSELDIHRYVYIGSYV